MPLDIEQFEDADSLGPPPTSDRLVRFLLAHDEQAYTRRELADAIDAAPETVGTNLTRLKERGLVRHREPYWAFTDDHGHAREVLRSRYDEETLADLRRVADWDDWPGREAVPAERDTSRADAADRSTDIDRSTPATSIVEESSSTHRAAATEFIDRVGTRLDDALERLYLFGSVARGDTNPDSDVDVLAVVSDDADFASVDDQLLDIAYDVQLEYDVRVEVHSLTSSEFETRIDCGDPFVRTVLTEGEQCV